MNPRRSSPIRVALLVCVTLSLTAIPASAHPEGVYYPHPWRMNALTGRFAVSWRFTPEFPADAGFRARVREGAQQWNNVGARLTLKEVAAAESNYAGRGCGNQLLQGTDRNGMHWEAIDGPGGHLAVTWLCFGTIGLNANRLYSFDMGWDSAESWHIPTSDPPSGTIDVGSAASHEFGHVTAWEPHFDDVAGANGSLCTVGDVNRHTMCAYYEPGTLRMRTLESHDIETFVNRYGR